MTTGLVLFVLWIVACLGHKRLFWPTPRSTNTGPNSNPPCGGVSFERAYQQGLVTDLSAGERIDIIVYEQIHHGDQPMRLAISGPNNEDFESCIWLNHIPQHIRGNGARNLTIPLTVPDFTCKNCTLQLMAFETQNRNDGTCCAYTSNATKTCPIQQYYSCANININGGSRSRRDVCVQPEGWAFRSYACNYYRSEANQFAWEEDPNKNDGTTLRLKTSGEIDGKPDMETFCAETTLNDYPIKTDCHRMATDFTDLSLVEGGDLESDGVLGIVVIILLVVVIVATYFISQRMSCGKKGDNGDTAVAAAA